MYRTLTKLLKNKNGISLITKRFLSNSNNITKFSVVTQTKAFSTETGTRFNKFAERSSTSQRVQGKYSLRNQFISEPIDSLLAFIEKNSSSFNDADYADAMMILGQKLEYDNRQSIPPQIEKSPAFQKVLEFINENFDRINTDSMYNSSLLLLMSQYTLKSRRNFLSKERESAVINKTFQDLEANHRRMGLMSVLTSLTLGAQFKQVNPRPYLQDRESELQQLGFNNLLRISRRLLSPRLSEMTAGSILRFINREVFNLVENEKVTSKARAFNVYSRIEWEMPFATFHSSLVFLLRDLRTQAEYYDANCILNIVEGLCYLEDPMKHETLREIMDIVTTTIKHQPENVRLDFLIKLVGYLSKINSDQGITSNHINVISSTILTLIKEEEAENKFRNLTQLFQIFSLFRNQRYFEDKETVEGFVKLLEPKLALQQVTDVLRDFKTVVLRVLGDNYFKEIAANVTKQVREQFYAENQINLTRSLYSLAKISFYDPHSEGTKEIVDVTIQRINNTNDLAPPLMANILENYIKTVQDLLNGENRKKINEALVNKISTIDFTNYNNFNFLMFLNEIFLSKERDDLKSKISEISQKISASPQIKKIFLSRMRVFVNNNTNVISNASVYKFISTLREYCKDPEYLKLNDRALIPRLIDIAFSLIYNSEKDTDLSNSINALSDFIDNLHKNHPELLINYPNGRVPILIRTFSRADVNMRVLDVLAKNYLKSIPEGRDINPDTINIMEKLTKSDLSREEISEINNHILKSEDNIMRIYDKLGNKNHFFKLLALINSRDQSLVTNELMKKIYTKHLEYIKNSQTEVQKLNGIFSLINLRFELLNFETEYNVLDNLIKSAFKASSMYKLLKGIQSIKFLRNRFHHKLLGEISSVYENTEVKEKQLLLRIIDKFTQLNWYGVSFFNKFLSDYEKLFERFTSRDHLDVIASLSRVEIDKADLFKAATSNIQLNYLNENEKVVLFNSLVRVGFHTQEWREHILERLIQEIDFNTVHFKLNLRNKLLTLINLWKLGDWPRNLNEMTSTFIANISKTNKMIQNEGMFNRLSNTNEFEFTILRRAPFLNQFDNEMKSIFEKVFTRVVERESGRRRTKNMKEILLAMGHEVQHMPTDVLCDFLLPKSKVAVIVGNSNITDTINRNELNSTGRFIVNELTKAGYTPAVVHMNKEFYQELSTSAASLITHMEKLNISNLNGTNALAEIDKVKSQIAPMRNTVGKKTQQPREATPESDDEK